MTKPTKSASIGALPQLRKDLLRLQETYLDLLCTEEGETKLERAYEAFLWQVDEAIRGEK